MAQVCRELGITEDALNALLNDTFWDLHQDAKVVGDLVPGSKILWQTVREGDPRLFLYYRFYPSKEDGVEICCMEFLQIDPDWATANLVPF